MEPPIPSLRVLGLSPSIYLSYGSPSKDPSIIHRLSFPIHRHWHVVPCCHPARKKKKKKKRRKKKRRKEREGESVCPSSDWPFDCLRGLDPFIELPSHFINQSLINRHCKPHSTSIQPSHRLFSRLPCHPPISRFVSTDACHMSSLDLPLFSVPSSPFSLPLHPLLSLSPARIPPSLRPQSNRNT